jgi:predicted methyltransferase
MSNLEEALKMGATWQEILDFVDIIVYNRPLPHREYDQIYMKARYMLDQLGFIKSYINNKRIVFLGDGDGMSLLLSLFSAKGLLNIASMAILDFDERILEKYKEVNKQYNLHSIPTCYHLYNVINPIDASLSGKFNFFYINPPYGSKNAGLVA